MKTFNNTFQIITSVRFQKEKCMSPFIFLFTAHFLVFSKFAAHLSVNSIFSLDSNLKQKINNMRQ